MADAPTVWIVGASRRIVAGLREALEAGPDPVHCLTLLGAGLATAILPVESSVLLLAPQDWTELDAWPPHLRARFAVYPWLVLADLVLAGAFFSALETQLCSFVSPEAPDSELKAAVRALAGGHAPVPPAALPGLFIRGAPPLKRRRAVPHVTPMELQCGCGVALGLTNPQIARLFQVSVATVKTHLRHLRDKLSMKNRRELAAYVREALGYSPPPP
jgi:DNA-binding NarL/FixJ family response regulator